MGEGKCERSVNGPFGLFIQRLRNMWESEREQKFKRNWLLDLRLRGYVQ